MAKHDDGVFGFMAGLFLGLTAGAVAGLILAPKAGSAVRDDVHVFLNNLPEKVNDEWQEAQSNTRHQWDRTRYNIESRIEEMNGARKASKMAAAKRREEQASGFELN